MKRRLKIANMVDAYDKRYDIDKDNRIICTWTFSTEPNYYEWLEPVVNHLFQEVTSQVEQFQSTKRFQFSDVVLTGVESGKLGIVFSGYMVGDDNLLKQIEANGFKKLGV